MLILTLRWLTFIPFGLTALGLVHASVLILSNLIEGSVIVMLLQVMILGVALFSTLASLTSLVLFLTLKICPQPRIGILVFAAAFLVAQTLLLLEPPSVIDTGTRLWFGSAVMYLLIAFSLSMIDVNSKVHAWRNGS